MLATPPTSKPITASSVQLDDLDEQLRQEQESSRRLRSAVSVLKRKLDAAEEGRRRSNGLERAFFSHLAEAEALVRQRDRLLAPGTNPPRNERLRRVCPVEMGSLHPPSVFGWCDIRLGSHKSTKLTTTHDDMCHVHVSFSGSQAHTYVPPVVAWGLSFSWRSTCQCPCRNYNGPVADNHTSYTIRCCSTHNPQRAPSPPCVLHLHQRGTVEGWRPRLTLARCSAFS